ncbi:MAG: NAD(P)H-dependent oxidoreductase subunit E [Candidatus Limnocylindrales bacterium]|jgi:NADH:ubiquinone oxidoreductase subunit E
MTFIPGLGIAKGMALTLRRFFAPKATIQYPETRPDIAVRFRGRLQLLYDELGNIKCETCFQCAQACPVECIDMGGHDTKSRFYTHWGPAETYAERREESALRRSGRPVPDRAFTHFEPVDLVAVEEILERRDYDPGKMLPILEEVQAAYGYLPIAAIKHISHVTGASYALVYGTATYYSHLSFERKARTVAVCRCTSCLLAGSGRIANAIGEGLGTKLGGGPADGVALEQLPAHVPGAASPLVTLDGQPQPDVTETSAAAWSRSLTRKTVA